MKNTYGMMSPAGLIEHPALKANLEKSCLGWMTFFEMLRGSLTQV